MDVLTLKIIIFLLLSLILITSGIYLRIAGKPYKTLPFTLHKLAAIGGLVLFILILRNITNTLEHSIINSVRFAMYILGILSLISGAVQSIGKNFKPVAIIHKVSSYVGLGLICYILTTFI